MKITTITTLHRGLYAHVCPRCGVILASASDPDYMPEFSICGCDRVSDDDRTPAYELFDQDGETYIRRTKPPRFVGRVTFGMRSDIEDVQWLDEPGSPLDLAKAMRKAGEFLVKSGRRQ